METTIWTQRFFDEDSKFEWPCPNCNSNSLFLKKEKLFNEETAKSKLMRQQSDDWEIEWIELVFGGQLNCKNCGEVVFFTGVGNPEHNGYVDETDFGSPIEQYKNSFTPTFFEPHLKIFVLPDNCPKDLKEEVENSFKLFWSDLLSCANKIRVSLEILMNEFGVKRFVLANGKRKPIFLHKRIEAFPNQVVKDYLLAIKWIGNTGSHIGDLQIIDILDAYRLLEFSLKKLYKDEEKALNKISKEIIKRKGARKKV
ncbi:MAG: DUF4145 domain-containing protein [Sphingobacteriales bacterium]|nr:DUF4145 domain-containing protein [Sphingobacteriales bacterium]